MPHGFKCLLYKEIRDLSIARCLNDTNEIYKKFGQVEDWCFDGKIIPYVCLLNQINEKLPLKDQIPVDKNIMLKLKEYMIFQDHKQTKEALRKNNKKTIINIMKEFEECMINFINNKSEIGAQSDCIIC